MEFTHLRSFVTVAKFGHLTRAAETLHLSQPALSGHIKALEEELGVTLFERTPSGMAVTPAGERLLIEAEEIIGAVHHLARSAQELRGHPTGHLKLGTVLDPELLRVGDLLVRARERYPQIELELHQFMSGEALARVRTGALDASFYFGDRPEPELSCVALRDISYGVAVPSTWARELRGASWATLAERPWIVAPEPSTHRKLVLRMFGDALPTRIIEADSESVIVNLVGSGAGISLLRDQQGAAAARAGRYFIWPGAQATTRLWLVHAADRDADPLLIALRGVLAEVWADAPVAASVAGATAASVGA
jgi:DNA-binding transcriptional LysR family regulator